MGDAFKEQSHFPLFGSFSSAKFSNFSRNALHGIKHFAQGQKMSPWRLRV